MCFGSRLFQILRILQNNTNNSVCLAAARCSKIRAREISIVPKIQMFGKNRSIGEEESWSHVSPSLNKKRQELSILLHGNTNY